MKLQQIRSRDASKNKKLAGRIPLALGTETVSQLQKLNIKPTDDSSKYIWDTSVETNIKAVLLPSGLVDTVTNVNNGNIDTIGLVLEASPFYPESGGQMGDTGYIEVDVELADGSSGKLQLEVLDSQTYGGYILHVCTLPTTTESGSWKSLSITNKVKATVDYTKRRRVAPNHTMTHVLNFALRETIGDDVEQKGY
jgi:alanyl-tRNA synthetase